MSSMIVINDTTESPHRDMTKAIPIDDGHHIRGVHIVIKQSDVVEVAAHVQNHAHTRACITYADMASMHVHDGHANNPC